MANHLTQQLSLMQQRSKLSLVSQQKMQLLHHRLITQGNATGVTGRAAVGGGNAVAGSGSSNQALQELCKTCSARLKQQGCGCDQ